MDEKQINDLRRRIDAGEQVSNEEILAGLDAIRTSRLNSATAAGEKKKAVSPVGPIKIDLQALLAKRNVNPGGTPGGTPPATPAA